MTSARDPIHHADDGQSLIEFALLAPLFLFLLIGRWS
jgi:hypothetical protein